MQANNIPVKLVQTPVLKVWDTSQLKPSEVLLTWLTALMFEWGGFNEIAGGGQSIDGIPHIEVLEANREICVKHPWMADNIRVPKRMVNSSRMLHPPRRRSRSS
jgi:hypothetical protein